MSMAGQLLLKARQLKKVEVTDLESGGAFDDLSLARSSCNHDLSRKTDTIRGVFVYHHQQST